MGNCLNKILNILRPSKTHRISGRKLRQIKQIAQGGYGFVVLVQDIQTHCTYVIGYFGTHQIHRQGYIQAYILMELAEKTVLDIVLQARQKNTQIPENQIVKMLLQTAKGLKQMHELGIIHKDIKIQNILISQSGRAKICDFGSCDRQKINLQNMNKTQMYKYEQKFQKNTTLMYRPPQMIDLYLRYPIDQRVDVWMLGCVLFVMCFQFHPFQEEGKLSIVNASIKYPINKINRKMENLLRSMLTPNPKFRITVKEIIHILQNWNDINQNDIKLNKVAQMIRQNQEWMETGDYHKAAANQWRNIQM